MEYETRIVEGGTFQCACGFTSSGWDSEELAAERGELHTQEHATGEPMTELVDFREERSLNGAAPGIIKFQE